MFESTSIANDNVPNGHDGAPNQPQISAAGQTILRHRAMTERPSMTLSSQSGDDSYAPVWQDLTQESPPAKRQNRKTGFAIVTLLWLCAITANVWAIMTGPAPALHIMLATTAIMTSLGIVYFAARHNRRGLQEIGALSAVLGFALSLYVMSMRFGLYVSPLSGAGLTAAAALGIGALGHSVIALRLSAIFSIVWAALSFGLFDLTALGLSSASAQTFLWGFPALWSLQVFCAHYLRDGAALTLSVFAGYFWLIGMAYAALDTNILSALHVTTSLFLIGALHVRLGKVMQDVAAPFGLSQTNWGWLAMMAGLLGVQDFWLSPLRAPWLGLPQTSAAQTLWAIGAGLVIVAILAAELRRIKTRPQSLTRALSVTLLCALVMALAVQTSALAGALQIMGLNPMPNIGLILGAVVTALSIAMILNGFRRHSAFMVLLGLAGLVAEIVIILDPIMQSVDHAVLYGAASFVFALFAALFAGADNEETASL